MMAVRLGDIGLLQPETVSAIDGLSRLRNVAAHGLETDLDERRALEYLSLIDSVSYAVANATPADAKLDDDRT